MLTTKQVYSKIKEISLIYLSGTPPLQIHSIAQELGANASTVKEHVAILAGMGLIEYPKGSADVIVLTDKGKITSL